MGYIFTVLFAFIVDIVTRIAKKLFWNAPLIAAYITLTLAITISYLLAANAIVQGINQTVPQIVIDVWGWVMPSNTTAILTALFAARVLKWAYTKHLSIVNRKIEVVKR